MQITRDEILKYRDRLENKINRNQIKIKNLEDRKSVLSKHGYWNLGYFLGVQEQLENSLYDTDRFIKESVDDKINNKTSKCLEDIESDSTHAPLFD